METPKIYTCVVVDLVHNIDKLAPVWERVNTNMSSKDEDIVRLGLECGCVSGGFFSPVYRYRARRTGAQFQRPTLL